MTTVVVGAGVVGIAAARALAKTSKRQVVLLDAAHAVGTATSSRSSEVIHAGLYYDRLPLKARGCVHGRRALYDYLEARGVAHRRCGKLLVATHVDDLPRLERLREHAAANGLVGPDEALRRLSPAEARALEPEVRCVGALFSPSTGIVDSHELMLALLADAEEAGAVLALGSRVVDGLVCDKGGFTLRVSSCSRPSGADPDGADELSELHCSELVNAAGLGAHRLARSLAGAPAEAMRPEHRAKGSYFALRGKSPFSRLVYPLPQPGGLGVHATVDLAGRCRFGPDVQWLDVADSAVDYTVDVTRAPAFVAEVRKYWPACPDNGLDADYAGVRPKVAGPGEAAADFAVVGPREHGVQGLLHLFGIESPGLTASLWLAGYIQEQLDAAQSR